MNPPVEVPNRSTGLTLPLIGGAAMGSAGQLYWHEAGPERPRGPNLWENVRLGRSLTWAVESPTPHLRLPMCRESFRVDPKRALKPRASNQLATPP